MTSKLTNEKRSALASQISWPSEANFKLSALLGVPLTSLPQAHDLEGFTLDQRAAWTETAAKLTLTQAKCKDLARDLLKLLDQAASQSQND